MKRLLPYFLLVFIIIAFLAIKLPHLSIRFSDTNVNFYEGYKILHGAKVYKDFFFTNLPGWAYMSAFYFLLTHGSPLLFFATSKIEVCISAILLFLIARKKTKNWIMQLIVPTVYLFSLTLLATSEHQTGVFFAVLCAVAAYYFRLLNRPWLAGIAAALGFTVKAYTLPLGIALFVDYLIHERKQLWKFVVGGLLTGGAIVVPSLAIAPHELYDQLFKYSLIRPAGLSKETIFSFFIFHDPLIFILMIYSVLLVKKNTYIFLSVMLSVIFLFLYSDVYFLYLNMLIPAVALSATALEHDLGTYKKYGIPLFAFIVVVIAVINIVQYENTFAVVGTIPQINTLVTTIKKEKPDVLYGADSITPTLAYLSDVPLLDNVIDTNMNMFNAGIYDATDMTKKMLAKRTILVSPGATYPEAGIRNQLMSGIVDPDLLKGHCKIIQSIPFTSEGLENRIMLAKCY